MIEVASRGELDVLYSSGGNFLEVLPDPELVDDALGRVPLRVHQDIVVSSQMLVDPGDVVVLLPAATRYEQRDGGTETTTERRIAFSPEIPGTRWARRGASGRSSSTWPVTSTRSARTSWRSAPVRRSATRSRASCRRTRESRHLHATGDAIQWGGSRLCEGGNFETPDGKAHFIPVEPVVADVPEGSFMLSTRRRQAVQHDGAHVEGPAHRRVARRALHRARATRARSGSATVIVSSFARRSVRCSARVHLANLRPGNVQVFFPEGNVLLRPGRRDAGSGVPDYNAVVTVEPE